MESSSESDLEALPFDVLIAICVYLPLRDVCALAKCSPLCSVAIREDWLWRCLFQRDFGESNGAEGLDDLRRENCELTQSSVRRTGMALGDGLDQERVWWLRYRNAFGGQQFLGPAWEYVAKAPLEPRQCHACSRLGDYLVVFAGFSNDRSLHVCDTKTLQWSQCEILQQAQGPPAARMLYGHTMLSIGPTMLLVYGGMRAPGYRLEMDSAHLLVLDEDVNKWHWESVPATNIPPPRAYHAAAVDQQTRTMYVFGGSYHGVNSADLYALNLADWTWTHCMTDGPAPCARMGHSMHIRKGMLYIVGGTTGNNCQAGGRDLDDCCVLDLATMRWIPSAIPPCPFPNAIGRRHGADLLGHSLVIVGGGSPSTNAVVTLDIATGSWNMLQPSGRPPSRRVSLSASFVNNVLHVFGGSLPGGGLSRELWLLHPAPPSAAQKDANADEDPESMDEDDDDDDDDGGREFQDIDAQMLLRLLNGARGAGQGGGGFLFRLFNGGPQREPDDQVDEDDEEDQREPDEDEDDAW